MRQSKDYKRQFKSSLLALSLISLLALPGFFIHAQTAEDLQNLQNKIRERDLSIDALEAEIAQYQKELNGLGRQKNSLSKSIKELDLTRKKLNADIAVTEKKIEKTNLKIGSLSDDIGDKQASIENNLDSIKLDIRKTNELETNNILEVMLSESDFTLMWNEIDNIAAVRENLLKHIDNLKQVKTGLEVDKAETEEAKAELVRLKAKLSDNKKIVDQNTKEKNRLLSQTKNSETAYQKLLKEKLALKEALEKEIRDYESQLQFILDPSKLPEGGVLSWPLDNVFITQLFGRTVAAKRLYASGSHSGVDFRASVGTPIKAVADGTVMGTGDTDLTCPGASMGKFVFVKHLNGLSTAYAHLSLIKAYEGEAVKRGQVIGYSGNTGHTTGPHLHLEVYEDSEMVDPQNYLPTVSSNPASIAANF